MCPKSGVFGEANVRWGKLGKLISVADWYCIFKTEKESQPVFLLAGIEADTAGMIR
jgi:hypothetical protein